MSDDGSGAPLRAADGPCMTTARLAPEFGQWLTADDVADRTGLPADVVNKSIADGTLPSVLVWGERLVPLLALDELAIGDTP